MKKLITICAVAALITCFSMPAGAASLFLESWGVSATNLTPGSGAPSNYAYVQEPYTGADPDGLVGPGYGGYKFDAKSAYIGFDGTKTYLAVVTGLPQGGAGDPWRYDNGSYNYNDYNQEKEKYWYMPGSLSLDIGGDGSYEFAVTTRANSDQATYAPTPGEGLLVSGDLEFMDSRYWSSIDVSGNYSESDPWTVAVDEENDTIVDLNSDELEPGFSYSSFLGLVGGEKVYAIEAIIDTALLGLEVGDELTLHWTMECGNDAIDVTAIVGPDGVTPVPEPATLLLLGSGIVGIIGIRKKLKA